MMSNGSVYLSKSNRANPDHVMLVRRHLESLGYEVLEHKGGDYDEKLIYKARYMVMVGINPATNMNGGFVTVGKGQYNQLLHRRNKSTNYYNLYFVATDDGGTPIYRKVTNNGVIDENNWTHGYGELSVNMHAIRKLPGPPTHHYRKQRHKPEPEPDISVKGCEKFSKIADESIVVQKCSNDMVPKNHLACITLLK